MKRILVLYRELAGYFVQCMNHLCDEYNVEADIIAYPLSADAPFQFSFSNKVRVESRALYNADTLAEKIRNGGYSLVFAGGWSDKEYLNAIKQNSTTKSLLGFDTWWNGNVKQVLSAVYAQYVITPYFDYAFVPGAEQKKLALKMGFDEAQIITGAYSCDVAKFSVLNEYRGVRDNAASKSLMYVGRYSSEKFITELQQGFIELCADGMKNWKLVCAGTGPLFENKLMHESIIHLGFLQPQQLVEAMKEGDAFVLPSTFEPWGVAVHEFAAAGFPLVLSSNVGAKGAFLEEGKNGFVFQSGNRNELKKKLKILFSKSDDELKQMGTISHSLAQRITPDTWARSLHQLMN